MIIQILIPLVILGVLGVIFGSLLGFASKKFAVPEDPLFPKLRDVLPGANCGGCGFAGCDAMRGRWPAARRSQANVR